jgi:Mg-chelatase subunit ChlD
MDKKSIDIGEITANSPRYADFNITNTSNQILDLLRIDLPPDCYYRYSSYTLQPNQSATIRIQYNPTQKGKFKRKIPFYISSQGEPITLEISGKVLEVPSELAMDCPDFNTKKEQKVTLKDVVFKVSDDKNNPLEAQISLESDKTQLIRTNLKGYQNVFLSPNRYKITAQKEGYFGGDIYQYISTQTDTIYLTLSKIPEKKPIKDSTIPLTIIELKTEKDSIKAITPKPRIAKRDTIILINPNPNELSRADYNANNIVFLLDISKSMAAADKLPLVKTSIITLIEAFREIDKLSVITYADGVNTIIEGQNIQQKDSLIKIIQNLKAGGGTEGRKAIETAFQTLESHFIVGGNNQIYIATDGDFKLGKTNQEFYALLEEKANQGKTFSVLGFGNKREDIDKMKQVSKYGNGTFLRIESQRNASKDVLNEIKIRSRK